MEPGFELYAAAFSTVVEACSDTARLEALRRGDVTPSFVHFPSDVPAGDILPLSAAFERYFGFALSFDIDRQETDLGLFVDRIATSWVIAIAATPDDDAPVVERLWRSTFFEQEHRNPDWSEVALFRDIQSLIRVCRTATASGTDLVMVWSL